jgi:membrane-bound serine protease (ClpP class)
MFGVSSSVAIFFFLLLSGLFLMGLEIFVPGGVLGALAVGSILGAVVMGFVAFPAAGPFVAIGIMILSGLAVAAWIRFFPRTRIGKRMTVSVDLAASKAPPIELAHLVGKQGEAQSDLRPAGFARIDGHRVDVVTQGESITRGERVQVLKVEGVRVVVARAAAQRPDAPLPDLSAVRK